jgi:hypothetical protein
MLFSGLEIVAGGYLIHRHYRKKGRKEQLEEEAQQFAGADNKKPGGWDTQAHHRPQHQQQPAIPQQKSACSAQSCTPQYQPPPPQALHRPRRHAPTHTQSCSISRRPVPQRKPHIIVQPSLQRTDPFATIPYGHNAGGHYAPTVSTQLGERDPPPFYAS